MVRPGQELLFSHLECGWYSKPPYQIWLLSDKHPAAWEQPITCHSTPLRLPCRGRSGRLYSQPDAAMYASSVVAPLECSACMCLCACPAFDEVAGFMQPRDRVEPWLHATRIPPGPACTMLLLLAAAGQQQYSKAATAINNSNATEQ